MGKNIFAQPSFWKCRISPHIISPQISPLFSLYKYISYIIHVTFFLQTEHIHCMWYFSFQKILTWMFMHFLWYHLPQPLQFAVKHPSSAVGSTLGSRLPESYNTHQKTKEYVYSNKVVYWSLEMVKIFRLQAN